MIRSESGCEEPYPTLVEALKTQNEISPRNISGTMVGLYCPDFMNSLNSTGWHFHFISADKKIGGHVLEVDLKNGEAQFDKTDAFKMDLPTKENFHALNFKTNMTEDIRKAEQDSQR
ncbi:MAG: acetolactate decarboxylase [Selenomonadaceae bacterium]|nr:acetolactate decarboxylase [Selenomonadaceae bacterium]